MNKNIKIKFGNKIINPESKPYVIAEIGVNHEGSFDLAKKLIDLAKEGGIDAAKFQSYKADTLKHQNTHPIIGIYQKNQLLVSINYSKNTINLILMITLLFL